MRSATSSEDSRLVRIVVPCAQTRLPGPNKLNREIKIVPIIPPPGPSRRSFGDPYGVTLRTLQQACFQGDPGRPLNPK